MRHCRLSALLVLLTLLLGACERTATAPEFTSEDRVNALATAPLKMFDLSNVEQVEAFISVYPDFEQEIRARATEADSSISTQAVPYCSLTASVQTNHFNGNKYGRGRLSCNRRFDEAALGVEIFDHTNVNRKTAGKKCVFGTSCARNTAGVPGYRNGRYCAYADVVVFGPTWGGTADVAAPKGC